MELTCFAGLPGTGKTFAAKRLQSATGAVRLSRDELRAVLFSPPDYSEQAKLTTYRIMLVMAEYHLALGRDVILEGMPFSRRSERDAARHLADRIGAGFRLFVCECPEQVALTRITGQMGSHPAADRGTDLYWLARSRFEPIGDDEVAIPLSDASDLGLGRPIGEVAPKASAP